MIVFLIVAVVIGWFLKKLFPVTCLALVAFIVGLFVANPAMSQHTIWLFACATVAAFAVDCLRPLAILFRVPRRVK